MDNFKVIYKILRLLEQSMDYEEFDKSLFDAELFGISGNRMNAILKMLQDFGYIEGIAYRSGVSGVKLIRPRITLKGLEYLEDKFNHEKGGSID